MVEIDITGIQAHFQLLQFIERSINAIPNGEEYFLLSPAETPYSAGPLPPFIICPCLCRKARAANPDAV